MILVRSLLLPLNGNKLTFNLLLFLFCLSSACSSNRTVASIPSTNLSNLSTNSRILIDPLDTLPIIPIDSELSLPIGSELVRNKMPTEDWQISKSKISEVENFKIGFVLPFFFPSSYSHSVLAATVTTSTGRTGTCACGTRLCLTTRSRTRRACARHSRRPCRQRSVSRTFIFFSFLFKFKIEC